MFIFTFCHVPIYVPMDLCCGYFTICAKSAFLFFRIYSYLVCDFPFYLVVVFVSLIRSSVCFRSVFNYYYYCDVDNKFKCQK